VDIKDSRGDEEIIERTKVTEAVRESREEPIILEVNIRSESEGSDEESVRSERRSRKKVTTTTTTIDPPDHQPYHQDLALVVPNRRRSKSRRREIKELEERAMVLRQTADWQVVEADYRDGEWELVERQRREEKPRRNSISVRKDRKGRLAMVRSLH